MTHSQPILSCEDVCLGYARQRPVLENITLGLNRGEFYFLTGASGAGKSTLLRAMALSLPPRSGSMALFSHPLDRAMTAAARRRRALLRRRIGIVFQDYRLIDRLTLFENTALPLEIQGESRIRERVRELLRWVGLAGYERRYPPTLSGGQQQRAAIARAVIGRPDLLLADEPTGSVDDENAQRLLSLFTALNKGGTTVVFATHDQSLLRDTCPLIRLHSRRVTLYPPRDPTKIAR